MQRSQPRIRAPLAVLALAGAILAAPAAAPRAGQAQVTGLTPLSDLGAGLYHGFPGGLYPGGVNTPPAAHQAAALAAAAQVVPRDASGAPDPAGWIGMIAVGMSNTTHEFGAFERNADADPTRDARVVLMDTGFGGQTATIIANPAASYWTTMNQRIAAMGLTAAQVQVAWLKEAEAQPPNNFPLHAQALRDTLKKVVQNLHVKYPNLRLCYLSSRIYGGYSPQGTLNPEPQAYESGFSVKWLIEDQLNGDPNLNYGQLPGAVKAPLLLWGPYLWADGINPRSDGLTWPLADLESDHVHPSPSGEQKVAGLLAAFFAGDPTAAAWWPARTGITLVTYDAIEDSYVNAAAPSTSYGAGTQLLGLGGASPMIPFARFDLSGETRPIRLAKLSLRVRDFGGGFVQAVANTTWDESTLTWSTAPAIGATLVSAPQSSRDGTLGANVTANVTGDVDGQLSYAISVPASANTSYASKEGGEPPRLVLVLDSSASAVVDAAPPAARLGPITPNPAPGAARIAFALAAPGMARLEIFAVNGRLVRRLAAGPTPAGPREITWDGREDDGATATAGLYVARLTVGPREWIAKVTLLR